VLANAQAQEANARAAVAVLEPKTRDALIEALRADGIAVCDGFLSPPELRALAACAETRRARGDFAAARIGAGLGLERRAEIRGDSIAWLTRAEFPAETELLRMLEELRQALNREAFLGVAGLELHYAQYPPGAGYARHVDQPFGRDQRRVSVVLYLNEEWNTSDGGALRIDETGGERCREIDPRGGRLVLFLSESRVHEVLPTRRSRLSLTGWFRARS
jgi:SM-20-related protein